MIQTILAYAVAGVAAAFVARFVLPRRKAGCGRSGGCACEKDQGPSSPPA